jgi:hypothetical protein
MILANTIKFHFLAATSLLFICSQAYTERHPELLKLFNNRRHDL